MKTKVIIENGKAKIVLTPEFGFEKELLKNCLTKENANPIYDMECSVCADNAWGSNIRMDIYLIEKNAP